MDFTRHVVQEKKRLAKQREDAQKRMATLESDLEALGAELIGIDNELEAIQAYETAKAAAPVPARRQTRAADAGGDAGAKRSRPRKVSRRADVLSVIASLGATGAGRSEIIQTLKVKGTKSAEQSVSNALAALKKSGEVAHRDGKYFVQIVERAPEGAAETKASAPVEEAPSKTRRRRGPSRRAQIVSIIEAAGSSGVGRADIVAQLGVKGDKSAEQAVSNALAALKKAGAVDHRDGKYSIPAAS